MTTEQGIIIVQVLITIAVVLNRIEIMGLHNLLTQMRDILEKKKKDDESKRRPRTN